MSTEYYGQLYYLSRCMVLRIPSVPRVSTSASSRLSHASMFTDANLSHAMIFLGNLVLISRPNEPHPNWVVFVLAKLNLLPFPN